MPRYFVYLALSVAAAVGAAAGVGGTCAQDEQLAPQGHAVLPKPTEGTQGSPPTAHLFETDPSGGLSRTIFETDENPDFKLTVRDFSFPPDRQHYTITIPSAAFLHILGEQAEVTIAKQRLALTSAARAAVPSGAPIEVVNNGEAAFVVRVLIVEAK